MKQFWENVLVVIISVAIGAVFLGLLYLFFNYIGARDERWAKEKEAECAKVVELAGAKGYEFDKEYYKCYFSKDGKVIKVDL